jgi:secreted trypsin-like serine protease
MQRRRRAATPRLVILLVAGLTTVAASAVVGPSARAESPTIPATPYIVNGDTAPIADHPYYVQVFATVDGVGTFFCGGSVVASRIVLTAAHCVDGIDRAEVIVGSDRLGRGRIIGVRRWATAGYDPSTGRNDIALLHLRAAARVRPITVVGPASLHRWKGAGHTFTVVGMGCTEYAGDVCNGPAGGPSNVLRRADIESRSDSACDRDLALWGGIDSRSMLCAGQLSDPFGSHNAPNACYGDSGGPLVVDGPGGAPRLVGAVSWGGNNCGDYPVAYARVAAFRSWLAGQGVPVERDPFSPGPAPDLDDTATPVPGDFNGDGSTDLLMFGPGAARDRIRLGNVHGRFQSGPLIDLPGTTAPVVGDWNGDGRDDLFLYEPGVAPDEIRLATGQGFTAGPAIDISGSYQPVAGDFNGDGRDDVLLYAPGGAVDQLRLGTPLGRLGSGPAISIAGTFTRALVGDYNGDDIDDIIWFAAGSDGDLMRLGRTTGVFANGPQLSIGTTVTPVVGDYNGDGRSDIVWFDPAGPDLLREATPSATFTTGPEVVVDGGFTPVAGDVDADGASDLVWFRAGAASDKLWLANPA